MSKLVGIINITPDSFSDGGVNFTAQNAINSIQKLIKDGADVIDIGAESTRPDAMPISADEEWARLSPILASILALRAQFSSQLPVQISIDTRHAQTAKRAIAAGVDWINDVSGFADPAMIAAVQQSTCKLVVMHSLTVPADKSVVLPPECDPVAVVLAWAVAKIAELEASGIDRTRLILDVGIGFGKTAAQSQKLIEGIASFKNLGIPLFVGHSRKSFLGAKTPEQADDKTLEMSKFLSTQGVDYLRVHNVQIHKSVLYS